MSLEVEAILRQAGALLDGHFQLSSGRHSPAYVEKFRLLQHPEHAEKLCRLIADHFREQEVHLVAGPSTGGVILSYEVARQLGVRGIFAEPSASGGGRKWADPGGEGERRQFRSAFSIAPGERVLVVDDVLTTGGSVRQVLEAVREAGGQPMGVGVLVDRSGGRINFGLPFFACLTLDLPTYEPGECPLCKRGEPVTPT